MRFWRVLAANTKCCAILDATCVPFGKFERVFFFCGILLGIFSVLYIAFLGFFLMLYAGYMPFWKNTEQLYEELI